MRVLIRGDELEITSPMPAGLRAVYFVLGLLPLLAPYELLIAPGWETIFHPFFGLAALVSLGALAVTAFLMWAALAGIETRLLFDRKRHTLTTIERAPILPVRVHVGRLDDLRSLEAERSEWTDGGPTFSLRVDLADGRSLKLLSASSRPEEVQAVCAQISRFLAEGSVR